MTQDAYEMKPVQSITAGAIGPPGQRVFYVQARRAEETLTILAEKEQVRIMAGALLQLLTEIEEKFPAGGPTQPVNPSDLELRDPLEPGFRLGELELEYEAETGLILLVVHELEAEEPKPSPASNAAVARFWATRAQMRAMAEHALEVVARGRPLCVLCGGPMGPEGHFCPKRNGHPPDADAS